MVYRHSLRKHPVFKDNPHNKDSKNQGAFEIVVMGSAAGDIDFEITSDMQTKSGNIKFQDRKLSTSQPMIKTNQRAGGGGYNVAKNILLLANSFNIPVRISLVTKLGQKTIFNENTNEYDLNLGRALLMHRISTMGRAVDVIDIAEHPRRTTPMNVVLRKPGKRMILKGSDLAPGTRDEFNYKAAGETTHGNEIAVAMRRADIAMVQPKHLEYAAYAAQCANLEDTEVVIDYDRGNTDDAELADELLQNGSTVFMPDDALGPYMATEDPKTLYSQIVQNDMRYPMTMTAMSNGIEPIQTNFDFKDVDIPVALTHLKCVDKNGAGDLLDAAYVVFRLMGMEKPKALYWASALSSFGTHYHGREWANHLDEFLDMMTEHPYIEPVPKHAPNEDNLVLA